MPNAVWPVGRHPPDSSRDRKEPPVSTSSVSFRHFISGSLSFAFLTHTWRAHGTPFPTTLTTTALDRSSSGWFAASTCTATAEGHPATTAGLLHLLHSTASGDLAFYIQPPSTFVFTPTRGMQQRSGAAKALTRLVLSDKSGSRERQPRAVAATAEELLADRHPCMTSKRPELSLLRAIRRSFVSVRWVVEVRPDRRRRPPEPVSDLPDREASNSR